MICPNCGRDTTLAADADYEDHYADKYGHAEGCFLSMLLSVLSDRGHDVNGLIITRIDTDTLWEQYGGPAADFVAEQLGIAPYPSEPGAKGNDDDRYEVRDDV